MSSNHIFIETLYGYKRAWRNVIFRMFVILGFVGIILYMFTPLSAVTRVKSLQQLFEQSTMEWVSQVLPSSIPFTCAYLFNILQLFFVTVLVINDTRLFRLDAMDALSVHPQGNSESSIGNSVGKVLAFSLVNVLVFVFCGLLNLLFYPRVFNLGYYLFYWLTLNLPTLVFCLGLSTLVVRLTRNQGLSMVLLVVILGILTLPGSIWQNGLLDPLAARIPNMFSDFTGHVNLGNYLLQRAFILFFGVGLAIFAVIPYPRIHNNERAVFRLTRVALLPLVFAGGFAMVYVCGFQSISGKRDVFREVYSKCAPKKVLKIVGNQLYLKETGNGGIFVTSRMTVENRDSEVLPLIFYLNPGLVVSSITVDGEAVTFRREQQVLLADKNVFPGETKEVIVNYDGKIDNSFCFLDISEEKYASPTVNTIDIYRFGYTPAFCEKEYKLLTPECVWYPVTVPPYDVLGFRRAMFTRYMLEVEHDPNLVAICQGEADRETVGKTTFTFEHDMKGISLCVGNYKKREIVVGNDYVAKMFQGDPNKKMREFVKDDHPTRVELFYLPGHEFMLDIYDLIPKGEWPEIIEDAKHSVGFYGSNNNYFVKRSMGKIAFDPTLQYPYSWISIVEVPCDFHVFTGNTLQAGERTQEGMVFLPEKVYTEDVSSFSNDARVRLNAEFELFKRGSCDLQATCKGNTSFIYSDKCPLIDDILLLVFYPNLTWWMGGEDIEYFVVDYMKNHSLEEALCDPSLSPELLDKIIRKKCQELNALLGIRIGKKEFDEAYHDFLKQHFFEETTFEEFSREIFARFHVGLDSIVERWYKRNELPAYEIDGHIIPIKGERYAIYDFRVFNGGKVPGIIKTGGSHPGWIIPPGEGRAIKMRIPDDVYSCISTYLSLNIPSNVRLPIQKRDIDIDTTTWFLPLESTSFSTVNENEIIVDNNDPGFTIHETRKFSLASLFGQVETRVRFCMYAPPADYWGLVIREACYGNPVKDAYFKQGGKGNQKVQWETDLPDGRYEVFCNQPLESGRLLVPEYYSREFYYTVFDGKEEHEVVLSMGRDDWNWVSLGVFDFHGKGRVTLSDRDRKHDFADGNYTPQEVVADAIKWVRVSK